MHIAVKIILWVLWTLLFLSWPTDLFVTLTATPSSEQVENAQTFTLMLMGIGAICIALTFFLRWIVFHFIISSDRLKPRSVGAGIMAVIGAFIIYGMTKTVETYGLTLFLMGNHAGYFYAFWGVA
ncbi:MAG: hypothetical protein AAF226_18395, partial [Verrucomicrobiota bacterium]